jgi:hypothetical protein
MKVVFPAEVSVNFFSRAFQLILRQIRFPVHRMPLALCLEVNMLVSQGDYR